MKKWKSSLCTAAAAAVAVLVLGTPAAAQWQVGDVFASTGSGTVEVYHADGTYVTTLNAGSTFVTGGAFDASGNFYVTNFTGSDIYKFDNTGAFVTSWSTGGTSAESITFDEAGDMYVGHADGSRDILKFDTNGTLLGTYDAATEDRGTDWVDLSADQQTIFYTSEGNSVFAYDVATNTQLVNFATGTLTGGAAFALRLLGAGDGSDGMLVANSSDIKRLDASGNVIQTYDFGTLNSWFSLNLDSDGTSFWAGDITSGILKKFDIATGTVLASISTGTSLYGVTVYGEITAGTGGRGVPEPSSVLLFLTAALGLGYTARGRKKDIASA